MAKIVVEVLYNAEDEIREILSLAETYLNMSEDKEKVKTLIQTKFQIAFNEGRKFQRSHGGIDNIK